MDIYTQEALEILKHADELIATPEQWTARTNARDRWDIETSPIGKAAVKFCVQGAISRATHNRIQLRGLQVPDPAMVKAWEALQAVCEPHSAVAMNDCQGFEVIKSMLQLAIASLENELAAVPERGPETPPEPEPEPVEAAEPELVCA